MQSGEESEQTQDQLAFICLALTQIEKTVEDTVTPWEKRNYWVKADKFRMEWAWVTPARDNLQKAILEEDMAACVEQLAVIGAKLSDEKVPKRLNGLPWQGASKSFMQNYASA